LDAFAGVFVAVLQGLHECAETHEFTHLFVPSQQRLLSWYRFRSRAVIEGRKVRARACHKNYPPFGHTAVDLTCKVLMMACNLFFSLPAWTQVFFEEIPIHDIDRSYHLRVPETSGWKQSDIDKVRKIFHMGCIKGVISLSRAEKRRATVRTRVPGQ
jgi:hypothetical protein